MAIMRRRAAGIASGLFLVLFAAFPGSAASSHFSPETLIDAFTAAIERNPKTVMPYVYLSRILRQRGERENAREVLRKGLAQNPEDPDLLLEEAQILLDEGDSAAADLRIGKVRREGRRPDRVDVLTALLLEKAGDREGARRANQRVVDGGTASRDDRSLARKGLIRYWEGEGDRDRTNQLYRDYLSEIPSDHAMVAEHAIRLSEWGRLEEAQGRAKELKALDPNIPLNQLVEAYEASARGDHGRAAYLASRYLDRSPSDPRAFLVLARAQARSGLKEERDDLLGKARKILGDEAVRKIREETAREIAGERKTAVVAMPPDVELAPVRQGEKVGFRVKVGNAGSVPLTLFYIHVGNPALRMGDVDKEVSPGEETVLNFNLDTTFLRGRQEIPFDLYTSDVARPKASSRVRIDVAPVPFPQARLDPPVLRHEPVRRGEGFTGVIAFVNDGDGPFRIDRIDPFDECEILEKLPLSVEPGQRREIPFRWTPRADTRSGGTKVIRIVGNDPRNPEFLFLVVGKLL